MRIGAVREWMLQVTRGEGVRKTRCCLVGRLRSWWRWRLGGWKRSLRIAVGSIDGGIKELMMGVYVYPC